MRKALPDRDGAHDFDFQTGRWRIRNERLVKRLQGCTEWETFESTNRAWLLPGGLGNMDEYVTDHWPGFVGMSLRLYNPHTRQWSIYWASNQRGTLDPPVVGSFSDGVGVFDGNDELDGRPIVVRFTWSDITKTGARWEQAFSPDGGRTWETNWTMVMTRMGEPSARPPVTLDGHDDMALVTFARFHARPGNEGTVADAMHVGLAATREEPGCLGAHAYRSIRDPQLFYIHSRWKDEAAFEAHARLPHTVRFLERVEPLIDHRLDVARTERIV